MDTYGQRVAKLREDLGETQEQFAERIGVPARTLQDIESGRTTKPQRKTRERIDEALGARAAGEAPDERSPEVKAFLDLMGAYLMALPEGTRTEFIHEEIRRLAGSRP